MKFYSLSQLVLIKKKDKCKWIFILFFIILRLFRLKEEKN